MDIMLKGDVSDVETARKIREKFGIPVVYLTACSDNEIPLRTERTKITEPLGYVSKIF